MGIDGEAFRPAAWLPGRHLQTVWGPFLRSDRLVRFERELVPLPDGDVVVLDHVRHADARRRVLLLHGLEGSSNSVYVHGLSRQLIAGGCAVTVFHLRGCAADQAPGAWVLPRVPRLYHSGDTGDLDVVIETLVHRDGGVPLLAAGVSVGGNVLLKWLGEHPDQRRVERAVAISVPYDLGAGARHLEAPIGRIYVARFLNTLKRKMRAQCERFAEVRAVVDLERALAARDFHPYDDAATAPLHGFAGADDYYERCSSAGFVGRIDTPTLCISAIDDPLVPRVALERARSEASPAVEFLVTEKGGHVGFVAGSPWRPRYWAEDSAVRWLLRT